MEDIQAILEIVIEDLEKARSLLDTSLLRVEELWENYEERKTQQDDRIE